MHYPKNHKKKLYKCVKKNWNNRNTTYIEFIQEEFIQILSKKMNISDALPPKNIKNITDV